MAEAGRVRHPVGVPLYMDRHEFAPMTADDPVTAFEIKSQPSPEAAPVS